MTYPDPRLHDFLWGMPRRRVSPLVASTRRAFQNAFIWFCIAAALASAVYAALEHPISFAQLDLPIYSDGLRGRAP